MAKLILTTEILKTIADKSNAIQTAKISNVQLTIKNEIKKITG